MNCYGCRTKDKCFLKDPPYQKLFKTDVKKFDASSCPCQNCLIKSICTEKCKSYKIVEEVMYVYYQNKWEEKEARHKEEIRKRSMEVGCLMFRAKNV